MSGQGTLTGRPSVAAEVPKLQPWITRDAAGPLLFYADARGQVVALRLDRVGLARLGLSVAEAQAALGRADLSSA